MWVSGTFFGQPFGFSAATVNTRVGPGPYEGRISDYIQGCVGGAVMGAAFSLLGSDELTFGLAAVPEVGVGCMSGVLGAELGTTSEQAAQVWDGIDIAHSWWSAAGDG